jgi:hypothetical protein
LIPDPSNPQAWNRYAYANNNPVRYTDPDGHFAIVPFLIAAIKVVSIAIDWGWTGYDTYNYLAVTFDSRNTPETRKEALGNAAMAVGMEFIEPDELSPVSLPLDDIVRHGNDIAKLVGHHTIPRQILKRLPPDIADLVRGKRSDPNIWDIPENIHKQIHSGTGGPGGAYNRRWREEIGKLQEITVSKIKSIRDELVEEFGLEKWRPK